MNRSEIFSGGKQLVQLSVQCTVAGDRESACTTHYTSNEIATKKDEASSAGGSLGSLALRDNHVKVMSDF